MGCSSSKQQLLAKKTIQNLSERTNATCNDSERTYSQRTYCDKVNPSAMMTTATGEVTRIETAKPSVRLSPTHNRTPTQRKSATPSSNAKTIGSENSKHRRTPTQRKSATPSSNAKTIGSENSKHRRTPTQRKSATPSSNAKTIGSENSKHRRDTRPPLIVRRASKIDRSGKTYMGSSGLDLDSISNHSSRSASEHSAVMFNANCDRQSLAEAFETFDIDIEDFSSHTHSTANYEDPVICIVRSDKLAFQGAGIRRHSRRKRRRQLGMDNTKIVILRQPSFREQAAQAAAEAEAVETKQKLENECSIHRSERRISRVNTRYERTAIDSRRKNDVDKKPRLPIRSNSVVRIGSSKEIMFEDKSEDLDMWHMPITA